MAYRHTPEIKERLRQLALEQAANKTGMWSLEAKARMGRTLTGKKKPPSQGIGVGNYWRGRKRPELVERNKVVAKARWAAMTYEQKLEATKVMRAASKRTRPTSIEIKVAAVLTELGYTFNQAYQIGHFEVDFFLPDRNLIVEADGSYWHGFPDRKEHDERRDNYLRSQGYSIVRIPEEEITIDCMKAVRSRLN